MKNKPPKLDGENATLIGKTTGKKEVYISDDCKHVLVCGTTGSGKTVALSNFVKSAIEKNYPLVLIDGKGDIGEGSLLNIVTSLSAGKKKVYVVDLNNPCNCNKYNPFQNTAPTIVKDMLINMSDWSEEHYKLNTERYLQRVVNVLSYFNGTLSLNTIIKCLETEIFLRGSAKLLKAELISKQQHLDNIELAKSSGKIAESAIARFATIAESEVGNIFHRDGVDVFQAIQENAIIIFVLNPLLYPELSPALAKLVLIDCKKAVSKLFNSSNRTFFVFDEISSYASSSLLDLVNKSRSANVTCVLGTQSPFDLDVVSPEFKHQVIENCNNYLVLRQNSSESAELWSNILGTRNTLEVTYQLQQKGLDTSETGFGSAKRVREFLYHPDDIKVLKTAQGIFMSKDLNYHTKITVNKPF